MTKFKVGDMIIYNGHKAFNGYDGAFDIGQVGVVKHIFEDRKWPYYCDFGIGGLPSGTTVRGHDASGLAPMSEHEINPYGKE